jgi:hypothetical protein
VARPATSAVSAVATASAGEGARPTATLEASVASVASGETACEGVAATPCAAATPSRAEAMSASAAIAAGPRRGTSFPGSAASASAKRTKRGASASGFAANASALAPSALPRYLERPPQARQVREVRGRREHLCAREVGERARLGVAEHDQRAEPLRGDRARQKVRAVLRGGGHHRSRHGDVQPLLIELEDHGVGADALDDLAHLLRGGAPGRVHGADDVELVATAARVRARDCPDAPR